MAALSFWRTPQDRPGPLSPYRGRPVLVIGRVVGYPVGTTGGDSFLLAVRWAQPSGARAFRCKEQVSVFRKNPQVPLTWGDEVSLWGPLMPVDETRRNQGGVSGRLFVPEGRSVLLRRASALNPVRWAASLRDRCHAAFNLYLPASSAQLLCGVLLGDRPPGLAVFADDFRRSGMFHLLVASGSNVGFALGVWWVFSRWLLWWPRRWTIAGAPFAAFLYSLMAGGDPPVLRAAVMAAAGSVGALLGRWDRLAHPLILSAGLLLLWNPDSLFQAGFQMSYAATLAIAVVWGRQRGAEDESLSGARAAGRVGKWARELFVTSLAAQTALAPLLLYYFGRFSWVGIGANMVAVPLSGVCLFLGAGLTFFSGVWPAAASMWSIPTRWSAESLAGWAHLCAKMPGAEWHQFINGDQTVALGLGIVLGFAALSLNKRKSFVFTLLGLFTLGSMGALATPVSHPALSISWTGGRMASVRVQTLAGGTVFEKGEDLRPLSRNDTGRRVQWDAEEGWGTDGERWTEGSITWEVVRPNSGNGFALLLRSTNASALLNFGLTARQQSEWIERNPAPVDLLSWTGGKGGPPKEAMLARLRPRWIVYQSPRMPLVVRRSGSAVYLPRRQGLQWQATETSVGFCPPVQN